MPTKKTVSTAKAAAAAKAAPPSRISPRDMLQMLRDRWPIGLIVGLIAAGIFIYFQPKAELLYRSEVSLLFESHKDRVLNIQEVVQTGVYNANDLNIHMEQLRSQTFFDYMLSSFTPDETRRIQEPYRDTTNPNAPLPSLADIIGPNVSIYVRRGTTILGIAVTNRNAENAALIANRYARRYIDFNLDRANSGTNSAIVFLRNQSEEMRAQVETAENALQAYRAKNNIAALGQNQNVILQKVTTVGNALVAAQMEQVEVRSILDKVDEYKKDGKNLLEIPEIQSYPEVAAQKARLDSLAAQRAMLTERYLPEHPKMKDNKLDMQETQRLLNQNIALAEANLRTRFLIASQHESRLRDELAEAEKMAHELDKISVDYKFLEQEAATKRSTYSRIVDRLNEASVASQMENTNIKIFDPAYVPSTPVSGGLLQLLLKSGAIALACFIIIPVGLGFMDTRVKTVTDVEDALGESLLGAVKRIEGLGEAERAHVFRLRKDDALAESYRGIYSAIDISSTVGYPKVLIMTSSMPGDGKSLTASNLAAVYAAHNRRTLLVDCDLRRPVLHRYFGVDGSYGWIQSLLPNPNGETRRNPVVSIAENFHLLPAGGVAKNPTETLERFATSPLLKSLRESYDIIILDTPPVAVFPDALLLCRHANELVYVCKFGTTRIHNMRKTLQRLHETGITVMGLILNQMPEARFRRAGFQGYGAYNKDYYRAYARADA
ncbi:polysaccharide biosynthesis tyrosine autokinase [Horticoccus luteus]|uniref:Polysaccharide biosynthesis tyrosine autokinase n=1 Tax=Horticoccus luteus TaxID=2862869 RepID=A0A8F9TY43_9BACT|nr:polysaccharide biosynthesis tyrosine autokinase [Horticoccus luteus]QYM80353.1 polysaccharide biosynthesis tyrosine autokinase [Horticoccus luteus]